MLSTRCYLALALLVCLLLAGCTPGSQQESGVSQNAPDGNTESQQETPENDPPPVRQDIDDPEEPALSAATDSSSEKPMTLDYYTLTEGESTAYAEEHNSELQHLKANVTGFQFGNIYDTERGLIINDDEIAEIREICARYSHQEMVDKSKRVAFLRELVDAIGDKQMRELGLVILVDGKPKHVWPKPANK